MMPAADVSKLWQSIDVDNSGELLVKELMEIITNEGYVDLSPEATINPLFKMPKPGGTHAFSKVSVDDECKVHFRPEGERASLPKGSQGGFTVKWLLKGKITNRRPENGYHDIAAIDDEDVVTLKPRADGSVFSFENLEFVFCCSEGGDRVYVGAGGTVDNGSS